MEWKVHGLWVGKFGGLVLEVIVVTQFLWEAFLVFEVVNYYGYSTFSTQFLLPPIN